MELSITYNFLIDLDSIHNKLSSDYRLKMFLTPFSLLVFPILIVNRFFSTNPYKMSSFERSVTCRFFHELYSPIERTQEPERF